MSGNMDPELVQEGMNSNVPINDPTIPEYLAGEDIGIRPGTGYGVRASTLSQQDLQRQVMSGWGSTDRETASDDLFVGISGTPIPGRTGETEIDISVAVTGEDAWNEAMEAWEAQDELWEQIAEGLFVNGYTSFDDDPMEIYDFETVRAGMFSAIATAGAYFQKGMGAAGMMPTVDALLKAVDSDKLQKEINKITESKKSRNYSRETIKAAADRAAQSNLHRNATDEDLRAAIAAVHELSTQGKSFNLQDEVGAVIDANNPERSAQIDKYEVIQRVKDATGHKSLGPLQSRVNAPVRLT
jgi:hypothetical protein